MSWTVSNVDDFYINITDGFRSIDIRKSTVAFGSVSEPYLPMYWDKRPLGNTNGSVTFDYTTTTVGGATPSSASNLQTLIQELLLKVTTSRTRGVISKTAGYEVQPSDDVILCDGTFTLSLHTAVGYEGKVHDIKNEGSGVITINPDGSETIDGDLTVSLIQYDELTIMSDGANWQII